MNIIELMAKADFDPSPLTVKPFTPEQIKAMVTRIQSIGIRNAIADIHAACLRCAMALHDSVNESGTLPADLFERLGDLKIAVAMMELMFNQEKINALVDINLRHYHDETGNNR